QRLARGPASSPELTAAGAADARGFQDRGFQDRGFQGKMRAIFEAADSVSRSILFAACIIIAAFIPLFTLSGVEGHIFGPMAKTYAYAPAGGLIATFTVTPALSAVILPEHVHETETWLVRWAHRIYEPVLHLAVANRTVVVAIAVGLFALSG